VLGDVPARTARSATAMPRRKRAPRTSYPSLWRAGFDLGDPIAVNSDMIDKVTYNVIYDELIVSKSALRNRRPVDYQPDSHGFLKE
jgi:hypothetical protein